MNEMNEFVNEAISNPGAVNSLATTFGAFLATIFTGKNLAILGAAFATIFSGIGSAKGVNLVARANAGLISEEPEKYGKSMLLQALPMTQGIYGMVTSFMIMLQSGIMNGTADSLSVGDGAYFFIASLPIAFGGLVSAIKQGEVAAAGISVLAKRPEAVGKAVLSASFVELYAILALLISLLLIIF